MKTTKNHFLFSLLSIAIAVILLYSCDTIQKDDVVPSKFASIKANADAFQTTVNTPIALNFLSNDQVGENTSVRINDPQHGSIGRDSIGFVYYPDSSYTGVDSLFYVICNGTQCDSGRVVIVITPNDPADTTGTNDTTCRVYAEYDIFNASLSDTLLSPDSATYVIDALANDTLCNLYSFTITQRPSYGTASIWSNKIYYSTYSSTSVYDTLKYQICSRVNGQLKCSETFVNINLIK